MYSLILYLNVFEKNNKYIKYIQIQNATKTCILPTFKYTTKYMYLLNTCICLPLCTHELSPPRPPLRCEEAKPTSIVKYNSNTSSIHTKCTPNTRTKYAIMEVLPMWSRVVANRVVFDLYLTCI